MDEGTLVLAAFLANMSNETRTPLNGVCPCTTSAPRTEDRTGQQQPGLWLSPVALAVEVRSAGDETWQKPRIFAARHVDEVLIVDPAERTVPRGGRRPVMRVRRYRRASTSRALR